MKLIKKKEIKAKRFITMRSPHKLKERLVKEEEVDLVDPAEIENRISYREYEGASTLRAKDASMDNRDQSQIFVDHATELIKRLDALKKGEIARLFRTNLPRHLDERSKETLKKVFRYAFGKKDAEDLFTNFLKEKKVINSSLVYIKALFLR